MKILYLCNHFNTGGITSYILTLAEAMKRKGHDVFVASGPGELINQLAAQGIQHIPVSTDTKAEISFNVLFSFFKLAPWIKQNDIDIIHANTRVTQVLSCLLSRKTKKPFISTCHGFFKNRITRRLFPCWGNKVIAISDAVKEHLIKDFHLNEQDIVIIHNGIDTEKFKPQEKADSHLKNSPVIGIIARLSEVKGHIYLIEAMKSVLKEIPQARLLIAGEGKIKNSLLNLCRKLGIEESIFFIPNIRDTREVISEIDVFVLPSLHEGLGLSLMEAMAMEKAVIGSNVGGIKALIQHEENGLLVEPKNIGQLSRAIIKLLKDEEKRIYLGRNARNFICANFSLKEMTNNTEKLYLGCLSKRN